MWTETRLGKEWETDDKTPVSVVKHTDGYQFYCNIYASTVFQDLEECKRKAIQMFWRNEYIQPCTY